MKKTLLGILLTSSLMWLMTGCGDDPKPKKKPSPGFHTNKALFINVPDKKAPTKEMRNAYMKEFLRKSDIQCQQYLNDPLMHDASRPRSRSELYTGIFDNVSELFGTKGITDGAKGLYPGKSKDPQKTQLAYERALSPEIMRGVQIARERQAQKIRSNKYRLIESYTVQMLEKDMETYDKLCGYETGLIEINRILEDAKKPKKTFKPFSSKRMIDPVTIKNKVESVAKEEEAQNKNSEMDEQKNEMLASQTVATDSQEASPDIWDDIQTTGVTQENNETEKIQTGQMSVGVFPDQESNGTATATTSLDI